MDDKERLANLVLCLSEMIGQDSDRDVNPVGTAETILTSTTTAVELAQSLPTSELVTATSEALAGIRQAIAGVGVARVIQNREQGDEIARKKLSSAKSRCEERLNHLAERWEVAIAQNQPAAPAADDSLARLPDDATMNHADIADTLNIDREALRKRLERWRQNNADGWQEIADAKAREPKYLYRIGSIRHLLREAAA
jgi:CRP-like cAMP-binding protein